jgi:hypothetical protein
MTCQNFNFPASAWELEISLPPRQQLRGTPRLKNKAAVRPAFPSFLADIDMRLAVSLLDTVLKKKNTRMSGGGD